MTPKVALERLLKGQFEMLSTTIVLEDNKCASLSATKTYFPLMSSRSKKQLLAAESLFFARYPLGHFSPSACPVASAAG